MDVLPAVPIAFLGILLLTEMWIALGGIYLMQRGRRSAGIRALIASNALFALLNLLLVATLRKTPDAAVPTGLTAIALLIGFLATGGGFVVIAALRARLTSHGTQ